jgi:hypothetical protein
MQRKSSLENLKKCKFCDQQLEEVVLLPCGVEICREHERLFYNDEPIECRFCNQPHVLGNSESFFMFKQDQNSVKEDKK